MATWWKRPLATSLVFAFGMLAVAEGAPAQDALASARDLYTAAAYDDALVRLNELRSSRHRPEDDVLIDQYRAFCLLALGRTEEAEIAIATVVQTAPFYRPPAVDTSPRIQSTFRDVRRRIRPASMQRKYEDAKGAFDRKDAGSAEAFRRVLELLDDPDLGAAAAQPPLAQLRTLATGFRDLSPKPAPAAPASLVAQAPPPAVSIAQVPTSKPAASRIYSIQDPNVVPPSVVRQSFAPLTDVFAPRSGAVEVVIDETGTVIAATTQTAVNTVYDRVALATAKSWRYRPAMLNGVAVKFRMIVRINVKPTH
jgi:hypothetical protein